MNFLVTLYIIATASPDALELFVKIGGTNLIGFEVNIVTYITAHTRFAVIAMAGQGIVADIGLIITDHRTNAIDF